MQILYFQWEELKFIEQCGEKNAFEIKGILKYRVWKVFAMEQEQDY